MKSKVRRVAVVAALAMTCAALVSGCCCGKGGEKPVKAGCPAGCAKPYCAK